MRWYPHPVWPHIAWNGKRVMRRLGKLSAPVVPEVWSPAYVCRNVSAEQVVVLRRAYGVGRIVLECTTGKRAPQGAWVDHVNGDWRDHRPRNLRWVTPGGNGRNRQGAKRVRRIGRRWVAYGFDERYIHLGSFRTKWEASAAATSFANKQLKKEIIHG